MQIQLDNDNSQFRITGFGQDHVSVNNELIGCPLLLSPNRLILDGLPSSFDLITTVHIDLLAEFDAEVIIIGSGDKGRFLSPEIENYCFQEKINIDCMTTPSACRTFSLLAADSRPVVALLL
ncbi:MAG: MTH938/NDUFAF3 family protein [Kangiellaceae bacterium]|nr:MTH938/NDUFAF3 family protein [Kangiellaceae bacterium]